MDDKVDEDPHAAAAERARSAVRVLRAPNTAVSKALIEVEAAIKALLVRLDSIERP
jgi:hypothetical protein